MADLWAADCRDLVAAPLHLWITTSRDAPLPRYADVDLDASFQLAGTVLASEVFGEFPDQGLSANVRWVEQVQPELTRAIRCAAVLRGGDGDRCVQAAMCCAEFETAGEGRMIMLAYSPDFIQSPIRRDFVLGRRKVAHDFA